MQIKQKWINIGIVLFTLALCYFPLCHRIGGSLIRLWDEGRNISNAIEMLNNGHWLTRYFENRPDSWELKPPFLVWCQAFCLKVFGFNEIAARMPSMFFSMATILLLLWLGHKITGKIYAGAIACIILVSCNGYIGDHAARYGDHDATLTFFSTALVCFSYLHLDSKRSIYLAGVFIALLLGWATKSITIFMLVPAIFLWALFHKKLKEIFVNIYFWIGLSSVLILIGAYYFIHEKITPGYFKQVWLNEWFGRYFGTSEDFRIQKDPFWYYLSGFVKERFTPFLYLFAAGTIPVIINKNIPYRKFLLFLLLSWILFFLIISAGTKNYWYDMPLYPIASLFLGILVFQLFNSVGKRSYRLAFGFIFFLLFGMAYSTSVNYMMNSRNDQTDPLVRLAYFLKDDSNLKKGNFKIFSLSYNAPLYLYIEDAKAKNVSIKIERLNEFKTGERVVMTEPYIIARFDSLCTNRLLEIKQGCQVRLVTAIKKR